MAQITISPKELSTDQVFKRADEYLNALFNLYTGYINYEELGIDKKSWEKDKVYLTYGEIKVPGLDSMIKLAEFTENDVFYDLGSGIGKVCAHVFFKTKVKKSIGIEANQARNDDALKILSQIKQDIPEAFINREMNFYQENFLESDISDATVIMLCSTCYGADLMQDLSEKIGKNCPNIRHVFSLKQLPDFSIPLKDKISVPCSWEAKSNLYWYSNA